MLALHENELEGLETWLNIWTTSQNTARKSQEKYKQILCSSVVYGKTKGFSTLELWNRDPQLF